MKKQKKKNKAIKDLFLDRPTSHGGWPNGHSGSYRDPDTPVYKQIANYLKSMGLVDDENPRARLAESLEQSDEVDTIIRELNQFDGVDDTAMASYFIELLADYMSTGTKMRTEQANQLSSVILKIYAGSHKEMRNREDTLQQAQNSAISLPPSASHMYAQPHQDLQDRFNEKYSAHRAFHDSFEELVGPQRDEYGERNCWWWPIRPGDVGEIYRMFVKADLVKRTRMKLTENKIRTLIREALSNYPPGMTDQDLDDYFGGQDLPSENADIEDIIEEIEETLEEYAEDLGYLQQYPHAQALRITYESDTRFFDEIYDEQILNR